MITLAFDTCLDACSVALFDGSRSEVLAARHELMSRGQAEALFPLIDETVKEAGLAPADIGQIAVTTGPGTFTGVRIGVAAARGLAVASNLPVIGLTSLHAIALCAIAADAPVVPVASVIDARRGELYLATYAPNGDVLSAPQAVAVAGAHSALPEGQIVVAGSGVKLLAGDDEARTLSSTPELPVASVWVAAAAHMSAGASPPLPLYLRAPDAKPPAPGSQVQRAVEPG
ncbi:MAG: tRNA (adenosine(37)-N6)-threonylcarbamoyltransferase complex dimerization subunit type 1 TsaB [Alphaproteobacteria bacterium]|nr:tRNA (adenosine(37)-N6)-threonylcarbamoyltransferase complex dimerization subunit type 1 TsaB [Alphaproteobacteria bacterium]